MSEKTTKQSFLNFIFKETVLSGKFWPRKWEGRGHPDVLLPLCRQEAGGGGMGGGGGTGTESHVVRKQE